MFCLFLFSLICLGCGAFKKRHLGVSLCFSLSFSQTCAPTHNGLKCKWQFYTLCFVCLFLNVLFCSLYSLTFRLACSQHARNCTCSNVYALLTTFLTRFVFMLCSFATYFCLMFTFWKFLRIVCVCVLFLFAHVGLTFLFCTGSFFPSVEYKFALLTLSFKNFYIQSHCLPTFFCCFCWSGSHYY